MATLPVLPLTDAVLLPGMVIPVTLDPTTQAAVDAARAAGDKQRARRAPHRRRVRLRRHGRH